MSDRDQYIHAHYFVCTYVIMGTLVRPILRDALEAIDVQLAQERRIVLHLIVLGDQKLGELLWLVDVEGPAVWPP